MTSQDTHHEVSRVDRINTNAILKFQERTNDLQATAKLNDGIEQFLVGIVFVVAQRTVRIDNSLTQSLVVGIDLCTVFQCISELIKETLDGSLQLKSKKKDML